VLILLGGALVTSEVLHYMRSAEQVPYTRRWHLAGRNKGLEASIWKDYYDRVRAVLTWQHTFL
jgi:hypothetical protein